MLFRKPISLLFSFLSVPAVWTAPLEETVVTPLSRRWFSVKKGAEDPFPRPWPDKVLKYRFPEKKDEELEPIIKAAFKVWTNAGVTNLRIQKVNADDKTGLYVTKNTDGSLRTSIGF
ncbi:hypothetical protein MMC16_002809 [Acarospora aff. strigata]|nr:hypothetical protein [Acarospora aff. strigata]